MSQWTVRTQKDFVTIRGLKKMVWRIVLECSLPLIFWAMPPNMRPTFIPPDKVDRALKLKIRTNVDQEKSV